LRGMRLHDERFFASRQRSPGNRAVAISLEENVSATLPDDTHGVPLQDHRRPLLDTQADRAALDARRLAEPIQRRSVSQQVGQTLEAAGVSVEILIDDRTAEQREAKPQFRPYPSAFDAVVPGNDRFGQ